MLSASGGQPFRIFFSTWAAQVDAAKYTSCVKQILADPVLKPQAPGYNYRMYRIQRRGSVDGNWAGCGSIAFGKDAAHSTVVSFSSDQWAEMI